MALNLNDMGGFLSTIGMAKNISKLIKKTVAGKPADKERNKLLKLVGKKMGVNLDPSKPDSEQLAILDAIAKERGVDVPYLKAMQLLQNKTSALQKANKTPSKAEALEIFTSSVGEAVGDPTLASEIQDGIEALAGEFDVDMDDDDNDGLDPAKEVHV